MISRTLYPSLFSAIGTTFGAGDGSSTFQLPDLRAAFIRGAGSTTFDSATYTATFAAKQAGTSFTHRYLTIENYGDVNYLDMVNMDNQHRWSPQRWYRGDYGNYTRKLQCNAGMSRPYNLALTPIIKY